jgi:hypothetical protein
MKNMRISLLLFLCGLCGWIGGCAEEDPLQAFDIVLVTISDCSQVGSNAVQCEDEEELQELQRTGRWVVEDQGGGLPPIVNSGYFVVTTEDGSSYTGLHFQNDGSTATESCNGEGGVCYFARTRSDSVDPNTECLTIHETSLDFRNMGGILKGVVTQTRFTDESCGTSTVGQVITSVNGVILAESVMAREGVSP